jgi:hypothetical protein
MRWLEGARESWLEALAACATLVLLPCSARAFTIETVVTRGCHEEITADALRVARAAFPARALALQGDDRALIADVAFTVPDDLDDIGAVTLLLGVRDNDVKSIVPTDLNRLAPVTSSRHGQHEHCLRAIDQDEPAGSAAALEDCRSYIREQLLSALEGLDEQGRPDGDKRERLEVALALRGTIEVNVPMFYLRAGRGLHALEDSFTHTFRNVANRHEVTVVLNWIEYAENRLDEEIDGPEHMTELDRCDDPDALRTERRQLATQAAAAALRVLLDPSLDRAAKGAAIAAVIDQYVSFDLDSACTADNDWCDAPELAYLPSTCGCTIPGAHVPDSQPPLLGLASGLLVLLGLRLRGRRRALALLLGVGLVLSLRVSVARAETLAAPRLDGPVKALEGNSQAGAPGKTDRSGAVFGRVALGASYDKPGLSGGLGLRYQAYERLMFGFDTEWNPWLTITPSELRAGALNSYVSVIGRFQLAYSPINVRTTASLGASFLLTDLVGAPSGSVGPFLGLSFLGVEWKVAPGFYLTIDPTYIAFPVPHVTGIPFGYLQYRFQVGLELGG